MTTKDQGKSEAGLSRRDFLSASVLAGGATLGLADRAGAQQLMAQTPAPSRGRGPQAATGTRMKIVILDDYQDAVRRLPSFSRLDGHDVTVYNDSATDLDTLVGRLREADAIVLTRERTRITDDLLARLPRLRIISQTGTGVRHVDVAACTRRGVVVAAGTESGSQAPAELTWALILASSRHVPEYSAELKRGRWQSAGTLGLGRALYGRTLGIWGYGQIGEIVAEYGRTFGMKVMIWGSESSRAQAVERKLLAAASQEEFFSQADVVSIHLRLVDATRGIVKAADLARMKPDALFVNTSRAELVEPNALATSLRAGRPGFAAVDVFDEEPVTDPSHPLLTMNNVLATPHIGFVELDNYELYFGTAFDNVLAFLSKEPKNLINPEALPRTG
jgi:D-3-phosphoglycerate dehydrogenase